MDKNALRKAVLEERKELSADYVIQASKNICNKVKALCKATDSAFIYLPMGNEVDTSSLTEWFEKVAVPKCYKGGIMDAVTDYTVLEKTAFGTMEPVDGKVSTDIDVVIVPGVAFSENMDRIGYGAGYYDRFLSKCPGAKKIAVCYDFQLRNDFAPDIHDVKMDYIVSDKRVLGDS